MVINDVAYYEGELWCVYELKDHFGNYIEELRLKMRKESQNLKFVCPDCGEPLILCAGTIMEPFFKHYDNSHCVINRKDVNQRNLVARRMLYHLAKDSYPEGNIEIDKRISDSVSPTLYILVENKEIVFEYLGHEIKLVEWENKHQFYQQHNIVDVWFLNYRKYQYDIKTTFEYMISRYSNVLKFIDSENRKIILKEAYKKSDHSNQMITKAYSTDEITINLLGEAVSDYETYKNNSLECMTYQEKKDQFQKYQIGKPRTEKSSVRDVDTIDMSALNTEWRLPLLQGDAWRVKEANQKRLKYLSTINSMLKNTTQEDKRLKIIEKAQKEIKKRVNASDW